MKYTATFIILFLFHSLVDAYSCTPRLIDEEIENSAYIFTGKVIQKEILTKNSKLALYRYRSLKKQQNDFMMSFSKYKQETLFDHLTILTIEKCAQYKGYPSENVSIILKTFQLEMQNDPFEKGDNEILFYCNDSKFIQDMPILAFDLCSRVTQLKYAEKDIDYLETQTF